MGEKVAFESARWPGLLFTLSLLRPPQPPPPPMKGRAGHRSGQNVDLPEQT